MPLIQTITLHERDLENEVDRYKRALNGGYRKNLFFVRALFANPKSFATYAKMTLINQTLVGAKNVAASIIEGDNTKSDAVKVQINNFIDQVEPFTWVGLAKAVQRPSLTIQQGEEVMKNAKYAKGLEKGALKIEYYNDTYDYGFQFWSNYIRMMTDSRNMAYPDNYMCTIVLEVFNTEQQILKRYVYLNCYPKGIEDVDHKADEKGLMSFTVDFEWQDFLTIPA